MKLKGFASPLTLILTLFAVLALLSALLLVTVADDGPTASTTAISDSPGSSPPPRAVAQESVFGSDQIGELLVDDKHIATLYTISPDLTGLVRAEIVAVRLNAVLQREFSPGLARALYEEGFWVLVLGNVQIATATTVEAKATGLSERDLVRSWRDNLVAALADYVPVVPGEPVIEEPTPSDEIPLHLAVANQVVVNNRNVGELMVDGDLIATVSTLTPDLTGFARAGIATTRLKSAFESDFTVGDIQTLEQNGIWVLWVGDKSIVSATSVDAQAAGMSTRDLAHSWRNNLVTTLFPGSSLEVDEEDYDTWEDKIVPLVALGSGLRLGGVQVTGPKDRIAECKAVIQLEGRLLDGKFRAKAMVPVGKTDYKNFDRIPKVGVTALVDIKL